jgi:hypothetical protein
LPTVDVGKAYNNPTSIVGKAYNNSQTIIMSGIHP